MTGKPGDPQLDRLHAELAEIVEADVSAEVDGVSTFRTLYRAVADAAGHSADPADLGDVEPRPRLTEAWFCCAEPTNIQRASVAGSEPVACYPVLVDSALRRAPAAGE